MRLRCLLLNSAARLATPVSGAPAGGVRVFQSLLSVLLLTLAGCTVTGALAYKLYGPPPVEAKYVPTKEPMLVLVERYNAGGGGGHVESESLAREVFREMSKHDIAPLIDPIAAIDLRSQQPAKFSKMTISQIGAAVGAKQVLYVNIDSSQVQIAEGSSLMRGRFTARVKVVDVATGNLRWPVDATEGYPVLVETPLIRVRDGTSAATAQGELTRQAGDAIAKLFYKWKPEDFETPE